MDYSLYSAAITLGAILAFLFLWRRGLQRRMPDLPAFLLGIIFVAPFVLVGARLWTYAFDVNLNDLINHKANFGEGFLVFLGLEDSLTPNISGLSFHGGLLGGIAYTFVFFFWYGKKYSIAVLELFDFVIPAVLILQIFGRCGNFFNQELLGDLVITNNYPQEWAIIPSFIAENLKKVTDSKGIIRHPLFLYEIFANLLFLIIILILPNLVTMFSFSYANSFHKNQKIKEILLENKIPLRSRWCPNFLYWRWLSFQANRIMIIKINKNVWKMQLVPPAISVANHWYWARGSVFSKIHFQEKKRVILKNPHVPSRYWQLLLLYFHRSSFHLTKWYTPFSSVNLKSGTLTALYLIFYNSARLGLQFLRQDEDSMEVTIPTTIILISLGCILFIFAQLICPNRWRSANVCYEIQY